MIVIKDVPGLSHRELLEALTDVSDPSDPTIVTGHGGFVVTEDLADRFLSVYLVAVGKRPVPTPPIPVSMPPMPELTKPGPAPTPPTPEPTQPGPEQERQQPDPARQPPVRNTTRRAGNRAGKRKDVA